MPSYEHIRENLTVEQMRAYIATIAHLDQADAETYMDKPAMCHRAAALAYAGPNPMGHHSRAVSKPGWAGAAQLFGNMFTVESAKVAAGYWVCEARNLRALGYRGVAVFGALNTAANARRAALVRSGVTP